MKQAGDFVAETDTRTDTTGEALRLMVAEMEKILRQPVSPRELGDAQAYLAGSFPLTIETPNDIAVQVLNAMFYELPLHEISTSAVDHSGRHPASRAAVHSAGTSVDRPRRERTGIPPAAPGDGIQRVRGCSAA